MTPEDIEQYMKEREASTRAKLLEIIGDLPDAEMKPPENVLFVCKLNPVTTDEDLELIFSRFGKINSCEVIRDRKSGDSLCYAFIEFDREEDCENAYFKMDNVLIDDRRIHVDFSQSVSKVQWKGKGTGTGYFQDNRDFSNKSNKFDNEDEHKPKYKINTKSRREEGYDLIIEENDDKRYEPISNRKPYQSRDYHRHHREEEHYRTETKKYKYDSDYKSDRNRDRSRDRSDSKRDRHDYKKQDDYKSKHKSRDDYDSNKKRNESDDKKKSSSRYH